jgi:hypothetical protein
MPDLYALNPNDIEGIIRPIGQIPYCEGKEGITDLIGQARLIKTVDENRIRIIIGLRETQEFPIVEEDPITSDNF